MDNTPATRDYVEQYTDALLEGVAESIKERHVKLHDYIDEKVLKLRLEVNTEARTTAKGVVDAVAAETLALAGDRARDAVDARLKSTLVDLELRYRQGFDYGMSQLRDWCDVAEKELDSFNTVICDIVRIFACYRDNKSFFYNLQHQDETFADLKTRVWLCRMLNGHLIAKGDQIQTFYIDGARALEYSGKLDEGATKNAPPQLAYRRDCQEAINLVTSSLNAIRRLALISEFELNAMDAKYKEMEKEIEDITAWACAFTATIVKQSSSLMKHNMLSIGNVETPGGLGKAWGMIVTKQHDDKSPSRWLRIVRAYADEYKHE